MVDKSSNRPGLKQLREAIPDHCFKASNVLSSGYIVRDLTLVAILGYLATWIDHVDSLIIRVVLWAGYGVAQGMVMTGIWILAHECGHQALFSRQSVNDSVGFLLHSLLLVPYFSWKYTHGLHHRYTNHMEKDTAFVPLRKSEQQKSRGVFEFLHLAEDAPVVSFFQLLSHQLLGWPGYLLFNFSAGDQSLQRSTRDASTRQSHFDPKADIFTPNQRPFVLLSDLGVAAVLTGLWFLAQTTNARFVLLVYIVPYLWVNHWIVAITYLHHTHPAAAHFESSTWTFRDGALATVDRDFPLIGRHIFHGIIEYHVVHHLFSRIPFYHAEEATNAISQVLGPEYLRVESSFLADLWDTFRSCAFVEASDSVRGKGILVWAGR